MAAVQGILTIGLAHRASILLTPSIPRPARLAPGFIFVPLHVGGKAPMKQPVSKFEYRPDRVIPPAAARGHKTRREVGSKFLAGSGRVSKEEPDRRKPDIPGGRFFETERRPASLIQGKSANVDYAKETKPRLLSG